ncbi:MAG: dockerin type I domain-containing protein, partial [Clostridiales bacterium]|nr:dockerin type I domain-containing protein [Clostridiales bacterium]
VSGVTFFSTFEVAVEVENATTLQNSNYQLVMNIINMLIPEPNITPIADVNAAEEGLKFTVEGYVTSNASGYDQNTAFFDCIYIQDETAGINLFPVAGDYHIGQKVRVTGVTGSYNGERELVVTNIVALDEEEFIVEPALLTAEEAMSMAYTGSLVKVEGKVTYIGFASDGTLETIMVEDSTGTARVFIDGYIMSSYEIDVQLGDTISAVGLASITVDTEDPNGGFIPRLRVRNREEIVLIDRPSSHLIDINGDGRIDLADVLYLMRYCLGTEEISENIVAGCDINGDGYVDFVDAALFQRYITGLY